MADFSFEIEGAGKAQIFVDRALPFENWPQEQREAELKRAAELQRKKKEAAEQTKNMSGENS